jgi:hypothetical protein
LPAGFGVAPAHVRHQLAGTCPRPGPAGRPGAARGTAAALGKTRDTLHGVWLGHPLHPVLAQAPAGTWLPASLLDAWPGGTFRVSDGTVARGPATAPQLAFRTRITDGTLL